MRPRTLLCSLLMPLAAMTVDSRQAVAQADRELSIVSPDSRLGLTIDGLIQVDGRFFLDGPEDNRLLVRRARLTFDGFAGERLSFRLRPESNNGELVMSEAYVETKLAHGMKLRAGKFKPPVGLERLQAADDLRLIERSFVTEMVPSRDVGAQLSGDAGALSWAFGLFNGVPDGRTGDNADDGHPEAAARIFLKAFDHAAEGGALFGIGLGTSFGRREGQAGNPLLAAYRSPGQRTVFSYRSGADGTLADGDRLRLSPQAYWYRGSVGVTAEWARVRQKVTRPTAGRSATLDHSAWQVTGEWFVTGERSGFSDPDTVGAVQLVARVTALDIDDAAFGGGPASFADPVLSVGRARSAALGANWFPLRGMKCSLVYQRTAFAGGAAAGDRPDEKLLLLRLQQEF